MKTNSLLSEVLKGKWLLDMSGNKSIIYSQLALKLINGEKIEIANGTAQPKAITSYFNALGKSINIEENDPQESVFAKVKMQGEIIKNGNYCYWGADEIVEKLSVLNDNPKIEGIILEIDSPGGSVSAAGVFQNFALKKKKPIIVLTDMCCSLGYLAAVLLGDRIFADNSFSATIGSIGVVSSFITPNEEYFKSKNLVYHEVYPDESSFKNKPFRQAKEGNYDLIKKNILSPMAQKFQETVSEKRSNLLKEEGVLEGATYTAAEAKRVGLIDGIGDVDKAIFAIQSLNQLI